MKRKANWRDQQYKWSKNDAMNEYPDCVSEDNEDNESS